MSALPRDDQAECVVLEAVLMKPGALETVRPFLPIEAFEEPIRRRYYEAAVSLLDAGREPDLPAIQAWLSDKGWTSRDMRTSINAIVDGAVSEHWEQNARRLSELHQVREIARTGQALWAKATSNVGDPATFVADAKIQLVGVLDHRQANDDAGSLRDSMREQLENMQAAARVGHGGLLGPTTGIDKLDRLLCGLRGTKLIVVAARPGHGKTALGAGIVISACNVEDRSVGAFIASAEMGRGELVLRMAASEALVDARRALQGALVSEEWTRMNSAATFLADLPIHVDGTSPVTVFDVKGRVRKHIAECGRESGAKIRVVLVDYLQFLQAVQVKGRSREQEVAETAKELKALAKDTNSCVIALAQAGRAVDKATTPPTLSDLRESGNIEAVADVVVFIHHPNGYREGGYAELHVAKHRGGPCGVVPVLWDPRFTRFANWEGPLPDCATPGAM